ncbi:DUF4282 domain-containing protein [Arthrobacter echini]|uniref:DUF4282 domain-containing protein n=1 Tax=Arthrobacter echini TaxID=1529066 RepID=A0A4S5E5J5_9MICC|nr:DUF4282 domain-containing protein [Arthrobacter echini]THJ66768.1 DUF4282 domain-containing protein [Arthrobacter echini]
MKALFDISFTRFIAPSIAKIVYLLVMVVIGISYFTFVILSFQQNAFLGILVLVVIGPIFSILYLVLARVGLESLIAAIRTAENTGELVRRGATGVGAVPPPSYPPYRPDARG